jgi:hypothetical protein
MLNWATMGACGLVMESVFTIIGMHWAPFFLNVWLITNASGTFASFELMAECYKYEYAIPFYHCVSGHPTPLCRVVANRPIQIHGTRTIMFSTKSHLALNFGVLSAWMLVGWSGICLITAWRIQKGKRDGVHRVP